MAVALPSGVPSLAAKRRSVSKASDVGAVAMVDAQSVGPELPRPAARCPLLLAGPGAELRPGSSRWEHAAVERH